MIRKHQIAWRFLYALRRGNNEPKHLSAIIEAVFGGDAIAQRQGWSSFQEVTRTLLAIGLIDRSGDEVELTDHFEEIRELLQFSTREFASRGEDSVIGEPVFGKPGQERFDVFVALPFQPRFFAVLDDAIRPACLARGLTVGYGNDLCSPKSIIHEVWSLIYNATTVIAECSTLNPNVFYEIGIAHTLGRHVILLTQDLKELPFDLQHLKTIEYSPDPAGLAALGDRLGKWLEAQSQFAAKQVG